MTDLFDAPTSRAGTATPGAGAVGPDELLADLNPAQRRAVAHTGGPLLVVAGAGSGKTRVLTRRVAYLLATGAARPGEILAITFTNKAAAEMRERVAEQVGPRARAMWVSTFHSLCVRMLRAEARHLPVSSGFSIYDAADSQRLIAIVAKSLDLDTKKHTPRALSAAISTQKNELADPEEARARAESNYQRLVAEVYEAYQRRLVAANAMDFDDLIMTTVHLLQSHPAVAEHYRRRFRHVLVDEYQDTNHAQYVLVRELVGGSSVATDPATGSAELMVVGDADQSIYAFRGATVRNIAEFEKDYPAATTVMLEQNYRSTQTILSAANAVIARNSGRRHKRLWTDAGAGETITGYVGDDEYDEARFISDEIDRLCDAGGVTFGDVAVFYRTNASSRAIEDVFVRSGMPYRIVGGVRFYERKEIKDALAYVRVVANRADEVSLRRIINTPKRGIGDRAVATITVHADQQRISFAEAMGQYDDIPMLATRSANAIGGFVSLLDGLDEVVDAGGDPADVVTAVLERTGYREQLAASDDPQDGSRLENLEQLVTVLRELAETAQQTHEQGAPAEPGDDHDDDGDGGDRAGLDADTAEDDAVEPLGPRELLGAVLEQLSLVADADSVPDSDEGVVTLMTLHTAKGLEFPVVFVTGWEDGMFPHQRSMGDESQLAEERRLAYVGITRARQRLYVSRAVTRSAWGQPMDNPPSRFLDDIPDELIEWRRLPDPTDAFTSRGSSGLYSGSAGRSHGVGSAGESYGRPYGGGSGRSAPVTASTFGSGRSRRGRSGGGAKGPALRLAAGDTVNHDKYGLGTVTEVSGSGPTTQAVIDFGSAGTVRLMLIGGVPMTKL